MIAAGESATLEFKSSLRWDVVRQCVNKQLRKVVAKSICGFLNTEGGTLLIGVSDDGAVLGIQDDINSLSRKDRDGFLQELGQAISTHIGEAITPYVDISFDPVNGQEICRVTVDPSPSAVFLKDGGTKEFYIRMGSSTKPVDTEEALKYIGEKWG